MNSREEDLINEFYKLKPYLEKWGEFIDKTLIEDTLAGCVENNIIKIFPNYRLKEEISYLFKALYRKKPYTKPIQDIEDKIGTRIVVLKSSDIALVQSAILNSSKWKSKVTKNIKQEIEDKPTIFDYQSVHLVLEPSEEDTNYSTDIKSFLTCEIQIRTLLQHAFAEISHDSTYKGPYKNDKDILRHLAKSMALMEATDDYFCDIFKLMSDEKRYYYQYLIELTSLFKGFNAEFEKVSINHQLTELVFELLDTIPVKLPELTYYVEKHKDRLKELLSPENGMLFQQPVILLIQYLFDNNRTFLREKWPLQLEILKSVYKVNNTSFEEY